MFNSEQLTSSALFKNFKDDASTMNETCDAIWENPSDVVLGHFQENQKLDWK